MCVTRCCNTTFVLQLIRILPPELVADVMALHPQRKRRVCFLPSANASFTRLCMLNTTVWHLGVVPLHSIP